MTTVVLGWDALDHELIADYDLCREFGFNVKPIDTIVNPALGEPHTNELWPTLITGLPPNEHGILAATEGGTVEWDNPVISLAASTASGVVPQSIRTHLGRVLRGRGAGIDFKTPEYYDENAIPTVFDGRQHAALAVPNYVTAQTQDLGLTVDRKDLFKTWIDKQASRDGAGETWRVSHDGSGLEARIVSEAYRKLGATVHAIDSGVDLVWVWFGLLDTVGHLAPAVDDDIQRRTYHTAAQITGSIRKRLVADDTLICVSDHGLQDGHHTEMATIATDADGLLTGVDSVTDVAEAVRNVTDTDATAEVTQTLESLGYI